MISHTIHHIQLHQFRNFPYLEFAVNKGPVAITGPNGIGKTNLLESLLLIQHKRGFKSTDFKTMLLDPLPPQTVPEWAIHYKLTIHQAGKAIPLNSTLGYSHLTNKKSQTPSPEWTTLRESVPILYYSPNAGFLFEIAANHRRKFIHDSLNYLNPELGQLLNRHEKLLNHRKNALESQSDNAVLSIIEQQISNVAIKILKLREQLLHQLNLLLYQQTDYVQNFPFIQIKSLYNYNDNSDWIHFWKYSFLNDDSESKYKELLQKSRSFDKLKQQTSIGPHKWDFEITMNNKPPSYYSVGQRKMVYLSVIMATGLFFILHRQKLPLILLDDVTASLDQTNKKLLFKLIDSYTITPWLTSCDELDFQQWLSPEQLYPLSQYTY